MANIWKAASPFDTASDLRDEADELAERMTNRKQNPPTVRIQAQAAADMAQAFLDLENALAELLAVEDGVHRDPATAIQEARAVLRRVREAS